MKSSPPTPSPVLDPRHVDRIDLKILRVIQKDGRISNLKLAEAVHLSPAQCNRRHRRLEEQARRSATNYQRDVSAGRLGSDIGARERR